MRVFVSLRAVKVSQAGNTKVLALRSASHARSIVLERIIGQLVWIVSGLVGA